MNKTIICPNCHSEIEVDHLSNFCQVCGSPIKNEEEIRAKAKEIKSNYKQGYEFYVNNGTLPRFAFNSTIENCEKIIAKKQEIIKKHNEILQEEKRIKEARELEGKRREVSQIQGTYSKGYYYYAQQNVIPYYGRLSSADCDRVIANKYKIIQKHNEIVAEEKREHQRRLFEEQEQLRNKAMKLRDEITASDYVGTSIIMGLFLLIALIWFISYVKNDFSWQGFDLGAFVSLLVIWGFLSAGVCWLLNPSDLKKIQKFKDEHPNDPRCKYL